MNKTIVGVILGVVIAIGAYFLFTSRQATAGPYGGDIVPLRDSDTYAELLANSDTGEVMVHTWDGNLKSSKPVKSQPLTVGSGGQSVELMPHPTPSDPAGYCSQFYGRADWVRGGGVIRGWMYQAGHAQHRYEFDWQQCWKGGRKHEAMWTEMGRHLGHDGMGHGRHGGDAKRPHVSDHD